MPTVGDVLKSARTRFAPISDSPMLDAHVMLGAVLDKDRAFLIAHPEHSLTDEQAAQFEHWVERHAAGEPVAYLLGRRGFYDLDLIVTPDVLIPRPETELLLEQALAFTGLHSTATAVDIGTGSGALSVTLAVHAPQAQVYAVDISDKALAVAKKNARLHGVETRIGWFQGDLLLPLIENHIQADLIMANLPYIPSAEVPELAVSQYEPTLALDGGEDGLRLVERLLEQLPQVVKPGAMILLEIGAVQGKEALTLARRWGTAECLQDYAGLDRIIKLRV